MVDLGGGGDLGGQNPPQLWNLLIAITDWLFQFIFLQEMQYARACKLPPFTKSLDPPLSGQIHMPPPHLTDSHLDLVKGGQVPDPHGGVQRAADDHGAIGVRHQGSHCTTVTHEGRAQPARGVPHFNCATENGMYEWVVSHQCLHG